MEDIFAKLVELRQRGEKSALCIVTESRGSVPRKAGAKMIVYGNREIYGTVGGGNIELKAIDKAVEVMMRNQPRKFVFNLEDDADMHCGGSVEMYIEPVVSGSPLIIFGAGHVGAALGKLAGDFGFNVTFVDNRPDLLTDLENSGFKVINQDFTEAAKTMDSGEDSFLVVTTPKHMYDEAVTGFLGRKPSRYLGMIGSRKKVEDAKKAFKEQYQMTSEQINRIDMPIGLPFNAETPREIAISILAKLIHVRNS